MKNSIGGLGVWALAVRLLGHSVPSQKAGQVVRIVDAETYDILTKGTTYRVRLLGVDAPEPDQAFGHQAMDSVTRLLGPKRRVLLTRRGVDLYGRTMATVRLPMGKGVSAGAGFAAGGARLGVGMGP